MRGVCGWPKDKEGILRITRFVRYAVGYALGKPQYRFSTQSDANLINNTLACHPAGLGNVSSKHSIDHLNVLTSAGLRYAKYCYQFTSIQFTVTQKIVPMFGTFCFFIM